MVVHKIGLLNKRMRSLVKYSNGEKNFLLTQSRVVSLIIGGGSARVTRAKGERTGINLMAYLQILNFTRQIRIKCTDYNFDNCIIVMKAFESLMKNNYDG